MKKFMRVAVVIGAMLVALLGLSACDNRPCLRGHYSNMTIVHSTGKSTYVTVQPVWHCDKYGPKRK